MELPLLIPETKEVHLRAASLLARCVPLAAPDATLAENYGTQAVAQLREAVRAGYRDAEALNSDPHFSALSARADFQTLLRDLATNHGKVERATRQP